MEDISLGSIYLEVLPFCSLHRANRMKKVGYSNSPGGPVIKTPPSKVVGVDSIPAWGAEIP